MKLENLQSEEWRARAVARVGKRLLGFTRTPPRKTPIFIVGKQRSGTTMLMNIFHLHPDTDVYDEAPNTQVFSDFRVRSIKALRDSISASRYPFPCYKIISDSHHLQKFVNEFRDARIIWMYREPEPNAASRLQKWPHATVAIRLVCSGQEGGGWFAEGVSPAVRQQLLALDTSNYSDFDFACLTWWARNQLYFELHLEHEPRVRLFRYEALTAHPQDAMRRLFSWLGMDWSPSSMRFVHARSASKPNLPPMNPGVRALCADLLAKFDQTHAQHWQP